MAFPDFFRDSTAVWWKKEIKELHSNSEDPAKSLKFDGLWIVSVSVCVCTHESACICVYVCIAFRMWILGIERGKNNFQKKTLDIPKCQSSYHLRISRNVVSRNLSEVSAINLQQ